jgi:hypothetical protein
MVIRMLAKVGAEMQEDAPAGGDVNLEEQQTIRDLMKSPRTWTRNTPTMSAYLQGRVLPEALRRSNRSVTCHDNLPRDRRQITSEHDQNSSCMSPDDCCIDSISLKSQPDPLAFSFGRDSDRTPR